MTPAETRLRLVSRAAVRFGRRSMHEVTEAAQAARTPMTEIWHRMTHAGRNIAKEASLAWRTVKPVPAPRAMVRRRSTAA